jgi:hypothetical protein
VPTPFPPRPPTQRVTSMNEASERIKSWLAGADQKRAEACLTWLRGHLAIGLFDGSGPLHDSIRQDPAGYLRLLADSPSICKAVERAAGSIKKAMAAGHRPDDIRLVQTVAAMLSILRLSAGEARAGGIAHLALRHTMHASTQLSPC